MKTCPTCNKKEFGADHRGSYKSEPCASCAGGKSMAKTVPMPKMLAQAGPAKKVALAKRGFGAKVPKMNAKKVPVKAVSKLYGG